MNQEAVLVLNAGYEPLHRVSLQHAIRMLVRGVAVVEESAAGSRFIGPYPVPAVLRLVRYVQMKWMHHTPGPSKADIKRRDHRCAYCGGRPETVDHVFPRSRGGGNTWLNLVAACLACNQAKADRTPDEAGMDLLVTPYVPRQVTRWAAPAAA